MAVERRGFNSASWITSYNQFYGPPGESFRFIDPYMPNSISSDGQGGFKRDGQDPATKHIPLVECAVSHAARCILSTANAIDMDSSFITKYITVQPLYTTPDGAFDPFWVSLVKFEYGFEEKIEETLAMMRYMCSKFVGPDCYLYPTNDPARIFKIDSKLSFDLTRLQPCVLACVSTVIKSHKIQQDPRLQAEIESTLRELEVAVSSQKYVADDKLSLADISAITTVTMLELINFDFSKFPAIQTWIKLIKSLPFYRVSNFNFEDYKKEAQAELSK